MTSSTTAPRQSAMPRESLRVFRPGGLRLACLCLLLLAGVVAGDAQAADCRLSLSQPRVDYGVVHRAELLGESSGWPRFSLGKRILHLSIACVEPVPIGVRFTGAPGGAQGFRFGRQGSFTLNLEHAQVDGQAVDLFVSHRPGEPATGLLLPGFALVAYAAGAPVRGRRFTAMVSLETFLPAAGFATGDELVVEGQGSFEWSPGA